VGSRPESFAILILAAKAHAAIHRKYSPDIEDVKKVAVPILRHRIIRNFKAEAEGVTLEKIIAELL
jgi:MoxR-like ATPase